jgi:hypothetical protein
MKYKVGFNYVENATIEVEANSKEEAHLLVLDMLDDEGVPEDADPLQREWSVDIIEELIL